MYWPDTATYVVPALQSLQSAHKARTQNQMALCKLHISAPKFKVLIKLNIQQLPISALIKY